MYSSNLREKQTVKRQYRNNIAASSFLECFRTTDLARKSTGSFELVHTPSAHRSGTAMSLARCEQIQNDNVSTSTFQINMQLPLILIFEDPEPLHSRSGEEMWNLTFLKNVTNIDSRKIHIYFLRRQRIE